MTLTEVVNRQSIPVPWTEGDNIPWNDPAFSARMLREHLSQQHDAASRRFEIIDQHVAWIHHTVLREHPTHILDLGCGPGFYACRLATLGHTCRGIDFSPASVGYAQQTAQEHALTCTFEHHDIRKADYGHHYGLAMLIFGEFNIFRRADAEHILNKAHDALADNGILLLEPHTFEAVRQLGQAQNSWYSSTSGLFSDRPHLYFQENFWDEERTASTTRYFVLDAASSNVTCYASSMQAYTHEQYRRLLASCGFTRIEFFPSLHGVADHVHQYLLAVVAWKD